MSEPFPNRKGKKNVHDIESDRDGVKDEIERETERERK